MDGLRDLLRASNTAVVRVYEPQLDASGKAIEIERFRQILLGSDQRLDSIRDATDIACWCTAEMDARFRRHFEYLPRTSERPAFRLLFGALADGLISRYVDGIDLTPSLLDAAVRSKTHLRHLGWNTMEIRRLIGSFSAGSTRDAVIQLSEKLLHTEGRNLVRQLGVTFSRRPPRVTPQWVRQFQSQERPIQLWLDDVLGGLMLFVVYNTSRCTYDQCHGCALPELSAHHTVQPTKIFEQTDYAFANALDEDEAKQVRTVVLSNNGSVFDNPTFPQVSLLYAIQRACQFLPNLKTISLESRAEFVSSEALAAVRTTIADAEAEVEYEIAVGVEIFDETLRNKNAKKGLSNAGIRRLAEQLASKNGILRCYFMLKPLPEMADEVAFADIAAGLEFLEQLAQEYHLKTIMHLNPTYAAVGTELANSFLAGKYLPPRLDDVVDFLRRQPMRKVRVHVGLNDEGLAVEGGSFLRPGCDEMVSLLRRFNRTGDPTVLGTAGGKDSHIGHDLQSAF